MRTIERYHIAVARAEAERATLAESAAVAKARIAPARIKADIKEKLVTSITDGGRKAVDAARNRPVMTTAIALGLGAWFARRPLAALFHRLHVRFTQPDTRSGNSETDNG